MMKTYSKLTKVLKALEKKTDDEIQLGKKTSQFFKFGPEGQYEIQVANDLKTRKAAYTLLYEIYRSKNYIESHESEMWYCLHDAHPDTITLVVKKNDEVVGASTVVYDSLLGLPCEDLYSDEVDELRSYVRYTGEVTSLCLKKNIRGATEVLTRLMEFSFLYASKIRRATDLLITVNPRHASFYKRKLLFEELGTQKSYDKVGGAPAVLLRLDLSVGERIIEEIHGEVKPDPKLQRTLYAASHLTEESSLCISDLRCRGKSMSQKELHYFFVECRPLFEEASPKTLGYLEELLGELPIKNKVSSFSTAQRPALDRSLKLQNGENSYA